jgi:Glycosyltransferase
MNTSLTEAFGIAILEAACAGLYVVSTRVGGVPEILPEDMISFANPEEDGNSDFLIHLVFISYHPDDNVDVVRAISEAIRIVSQGKHDPMRAHERVKTFYDWVQVTERTERVYDSVLKSKQRDLWERMQRQVLQVICFRSRSEGLMKDDATRTFRGPNIHHYSDRRLPLLPVPGMVDATRGYRFRQKSLGSCSVRRRKYCTRCCVSVT